MNTRPAIPRRTHPIYTGRYLLATNQVSALYDTVVQWITCRSPGGLIYGRQRIGKTRAIRFLMEFLPQEFGSDLPIFLFLCQEHKIANEKMFFESMLTNVRHPLALDPPHRASVKRDRLYNFLIEKGYTSVEKRIILLMDDAQRLHSYHYEWLMDIYNELDRAGIEMTVLLVGQKELKHQKDAFISAGKSQIVGRFMVHEQQFFGLRTMADIQTCLEGYDEGSTYPDDSDWSYSRYFFPDLFDQGFRISHLTKDFYESFMSMRKEAGIHNRLEIPMQYFTRAVEYIFNTYGIEGKNVNQVTVTHIVAAIQFTKYIEAELAVAMLGE